MYRTTGELPASPASSNCLPQLISIVKTCKAREDISNDGYHLASFYGGICKCKAERCSCGNRSDGGFIFESCGYP